LQWFGVSFVMHLILAVVLGVIVSHGLRFSCKRCWVASVSNSLRKLPNQDGVG